MFKKALFTFLTFGLLTTSVLSFMAPSANAEDGTGPWYAPTYQQWYTKVYDSSNPTEIYGERYTAAQVWWIIYALRAYIQTNIGNAQIWQCIYSNFNPSDCLPGLLADNSQQSIAAAQNIPQPSLLTSFLADRPLSGITYTKDKLRNFHIIPEAQAQSGYGFGALTMIQNLWGAARDAAYALIILVIIVFAFMIMFRTKISPQAVITVQSALPKIIITLILVTFSYAIAGFMIDAMYIVLGLISLIFVNSGLTQSINWWVQGSPASLFNFLTNGPSIPAVGGTGIFGMFVVYWTLFSATLTASVVLPGAFGSVLGTLLSPILSIVTMPLGAIIELLVSIVLLIVTFRAMFTLLKTFVSIILLVVVAPIAILFGALSPAGGGFGGWFKNLAAHLAVYPTTAVLFLVSLIFLDAAYANTTVGQFGNLMSNIINNATGIQIASTPVVAAGSTWVPPLTFGTSGVVWMWLFASLATIGLIPKVSEIVKGYISGKPFAYGTGIGQAFGPATGLTKTGGITGISMAEKQLTGAKGRFAQGTPGGAAVEQIAGALRRSLGGR